jgi:intracellular multiplication protein IcmC
MMLPKWAQLKLDKSTTYLVTAFMLLLMSIPVWAAESNDSFTLATGTSISAQTMLINFAKSVPNLMRMVTAIAYVMGMYFIFYGVVKMKELGESRTMMSREHSIWGPIVLLTVGALLIYLPTSVQVGMSTFWTNPNPYGYEDAEKSDQWAQFFAVCFTIIQLVGVIAFIRGLVILSHMGGGHAQQGTFSKGLTHIIGGIFCINMYETVQVILVTLGVQIN